MDTQKDFVGFVKTPTPITLSPETLSHLTKVEVDESIVAPSRKQVDVQLLLNMFFSDYKNFKILFNQNTLEEQQLFLDQLIQVTQVPLQFIHHTNSKLYELIGKHLPGYKSLRDKNVFQLQENRLVAIRPELMYVDTKQDFYFLFKYFQTLTSGEVQVELTDFFMDPTLDFNRIFVQ